MRQFSNHLIRLVSLDRFRVFIDIISELKSIEIYVKQSSYNKVRGVLRRT